jgi:hypothetical protein
LNFKALLIMTYPTTTHPNRLTYFLMGIVVLLLIPFIAMQLTDEVNWSAGDFQIMGGMLLLGALGLEGTLRMIKGSGKRALMIALIVALFLLTWAELAVGIFGTPFAGS